MYDRSASSLASTATPPAPSLSQLSLLQEEIIKAQSSYDSTKKILEGLGAALEKQKRQMLEYMNEAKLTNFKTSSGTMILNRRFAVTVPKGPDLEAFLSYLQDQKPDSYRALRTVNYQTLNGWYKEELDAAVERGELDFQIPGLHEPTVNEYLSVRKA